MNHHIPVKRQLRGRKRKEIAKRCRLEGTMNVRDNLIINVTENEVKARDLTNIINSDVSYFRVIKVPLLQHKRSLKPYEFIKKIFTHTTSKIKEAEIYEPINSKKTIKSNTNKKLKQNKENIDLNTKDEWKQRQARQPLYYTNTSIDKILKSNQNLK